MNKTINDITIPFELEYNEYPILNISKITVVTSDKKWVNRFYSAGLTVKIIAVSNDNLNNVLGSKEEYLTFGTYISSYHTGFDLNINRFFTLEDENLPNSSLRNHNKFKIIITY